MRNMHGKIYVYDSLLFIEQWTAHIDSILYNTYLLFYIRSLATNQNKQCELRISNITNIIILSLVYLYTEWTNYTIVMDFFF